MQQRRLRLGDILDDYCPRERRVTNHVIVAMVGDEVKQTRCTTCDADHEYKQARVPPQRRKRDTPALGESGGATLRSPGVPDEPPGFQEPAETGEVAEAAAEPVEAVAAPEPAEEVSEPAAAPSDEEGPVHRRLIRATLPRPNGQMPERKEPEFTIRQPGMRGPHSKKGPRHARRGMRQPGGLSRFGVPGHGSGQPPRHGSGQGPRHGGGAGPGHRPSGNRPGPPHGARGNRSGGGRGGRKRGR